MYMYLVTGDEKKTTTDCSQLVTDIPSSIHINVWRELDWPLSTVAIDTGLTFKGCDL